MSCKVPFKSKAIAKAVAKTMIKHNRLEQARTYYCKQCSAWHITHLTKREYRLI